MHSQGPPQESQPVPQPVAPVVMVNRKTNAYAVASFILSLLWIFWLGSILAIVFGALAFHQIDSSQNTESGKVFAGLGIVFGCLAFLPALLVMGAGA